MFSPSAKTFEAIYYVLMICRSRIKYILFEKLENRMYVLIMSHMCFRVNLYSMQLLECQRTT